MARSKTAFASNDQASGEQASAAPASAPEALGSPGAEPVASPAVEAAAEPAVPVPVAVAKPAGVKKVPVGKKAPASEKAAAGKKAPAGKMASAAGKTPAANQAPVAKRVAKPAPARADAAATPPVEPAKAAKPQKTKLVRDSFTIPKGEYQVLDALKSRAIAGGQHVKKGELLRAGIQALAALSDRAFLKAIQAVPTLKTGRPKADDSAS